MNTLSAKSIDITAFFSFYRHIKLHGILSGGANGKSMTKNQKARLVGKSLELYGSRLNQLLEKAKEIGELESRLDEKRKQYEDLKAQFKPYLENERRFILGQMKLVTKIALVLESIEGRLISRDEWLSAGQIRAEILARLGQNYGATAVRNALVAGEGDTFERTGEGKGTKWRYIGGDDPFDMATGDLNIE